MTKSAPEGRLYQASLFFSVILAIAHVVLFIGPPASEYVNNGTLAKTLFYLGSSHSILSLIWISSTTFSDFFPPTFDSNSATFSSSAPISVKVSTEKRSRYLAILAIQVLSETTLFMDLSLIWWYGVRWAWKLRILTEYEGAFKFSSRMLFPMYALWLSAMWTIGNVLGLIVLGHIMLIGKQAGVEEVVCWG